MKLTDDDRAAIARAYADGERSGRIAARYGVSQDTVTRVAREHGVEIRHMGRPPGPPEEIGYTGRWVRDGLVWRAEP